MDSQSSSHRANSPNAEEATTANNAESPVIEQNPIVVEEEIAQTTEADVEESHRLDEAIGGLELSSHEEPPYQPLRLPSLDSLGKQSKIIREDQPTDITPEPKESAAAQSQNASDEITVEELFPDPTAKEEWKKVKYLLDQAYEWRLETEEAEEHAFERLRLFIRQHGSLGKRLAGDYPRWVTELQQEKAAGKEVAKNREAVKKAKEAKAKEAEAARKKAEEAKRALTSVAQKARELVLKAQADYENSLRAASFKEVELAKVESGQIPPKPKRWCAVCKTPDVSRPAECPNQPFHYVMSRLDRLEKAEKEEQEKK